MVNENFKKLLTKRNKIIVLCVLAAIFLISIYTTYTLFTRQDDEVVPTEAEEEQGVDWGTIEIFLTPPDGSGESEPVLVETG